MYRSSSLTPLEEHTIIDGYAFLLLSLGLWEWAVYVFLCVLSAPGRESSCRIQRAKSLVLQNFNRNKESLEKGKFLMETLCLPQAWFQEARAHRALNSGDALEYITYKLKLDEQEGIKVIERTMVPNILFTNRAKQETVLQLFDDLSLFEEENNSLVWAISTFFEIYDEIQHLEISSGNKEKVIPVLLEDLQKIEQIFASYKERENKMLQNGLEIVPQTYLVSMAAFLSEALHQISIFKLQIFSLKEGMTIASTASQKLKLLRSQISCGQSIVNKENVCRWLM